MTACIMKEQEISFATVKESKSHDPRAGGFGN
jgi:hypothetical protein